ncbi:MAG: hypothetical protein R3Y67_07810 [Eubacteriales bacterium]
MSMSISGISSYSSAMEISGLSQVQVNTDENKTSTTFTSGYDTVEISEEGQAASQASKAAPPPPPPSESSSTDDEDSTDTLSAEEFLANLLENAEEDDESTLDLAEVIEQANAL